MNKRQRGKVARYLSDLEASGLHRLDDKMYEKLISKLQKGHMSYDNNELSIMRAAITLNRFGMPLSYICKKYIAFAVAHNERAQAA